MENLTTANAHRVSTIENIAHPEWGTKKFSYNLDGEGMSTQGVGCNAAILFDDEFKFWHVMTWL